MEPVEKKSASRWMPFIHALEVVFFLYCFLLSVKLLGSGFEMFGEEFARQLIAITSGHPFVGLFIGVLATSIVQSSSMTTSMVVSLVAAGTLDLTGAVPIVMGANIGTTVTNLLVSMTHFTRKDEFERAMAAASVHDFFNLMTVIILLPIETATGYLQRAASFMAHYLYSPAGDQVKMWNPIKATVNPMVKLIHRAVDPVGGKAAAIIVVVLALLLLFVSLYFLVRIMKSAALSKLEVIFDRYMDKHGLLGMVLGLVVTAVVQSSSVTTSLLVPLAAAGIMTVGQVFPITLGANVGTTVTALLASLTGDVNGLAIALVHVLFNLTGILLIYPLPPIRRIPIRLAKMLARKSVKSKYFAFVFVGCVFYGVPLVMIVVTRLLK